MTQTWAVFPPSNELCAEDTEFRPTGDVFRHERGSGITNKPVLLVVYFSTWSVISSKTAVFRELECQLILKPAGPSSE